MGDAKLLRSPRKQSLLAGCGEQKFALVPNFVKCDNKQLKR